jgi:hypothetical protein
MSQKEWQRCLQQQLEPVLTAPDSGVGLSTYTDITLPRDAPSDP